MNIVRMDKIGKMWVKYGRDELRGSWNQRSKELGSLELRWQDEKSSILGIWLSEIKTIINN